MWKNAIRTQMFNANLHKKLRFLRPSHKKETVFLEEIYAYYVMSSRKLSCCTRKSRHGGVEKD